MSNQPTEIIDILPAFIENPLPIRIQLEEGVSVDTPITAVIGVDGVIQSMSIPVTFDSSLITFTVNTDQLKSLPLNNRKKSTIYVRFAGKTVFTIPLKLTMDGSTPAPRTFVISAPGFGVIRTSIYDDFGFLKKIEEAANRAENAAAGAFKERGYFNASTGIATIRDNPNGIDTTFTPNTTPSVPAGQSFKVVTEGTSSINGFPVLMKVGATIVSRGVKWDYIPPPDTGFEKSLQVEQEVVSKTQVSPGYSKSFSVALQNSATYNSTTRLLTIPVAATGQNTTMTTGNNIPANTLGFINGDVLEISVLVFESAKEGFSSRGQVQLNMARNDAAVLNVAPAAVVERLNDNYVKYTLTYTFQNGDIFFIPVLRIVNASVVSGSPLNLTISDVIIENVSRPKVNLLSESINQVTGLAVREQVDPNYIPKRAGSFSTSKPGNYIGFIDQQKWPILFNVSIKRATDGVWAPSDITDFSWTDDKGFTRPFALIDGSFWGLVYGTTSTAADWARNTYITATDSTFVKINIVSSAFSDWVADIKWFYPDQTYVGRTTFVPVGVNRDVPIPYLKIFEGEPLVTLVGDPIKGFNKVVEDVRITPVIDKKIRQVMPSQPIITRRLEASTGSNFMNLNVRRSSGGAWNLADIESVSIINDITGAVTNVSLVKASYWTDTATVATAGGEEWARSSAQYPVTHNSYSVVIKLSPSVQYNDFIYQLKFMKDSALRAKNDWTLPVETPIESGFVNYTNLAGMFTESAGDKTIYIKGKYYELNPQRHIPSGWKIKGRGMGVDEWAIEFDRNIDSGVDGIFAEGDIEISGLRLVSIEDNFLVGPHFNSPSYIIHTDKNTGPFTTKISECHLVSKVKNPDLPGTPSASTLLGIGTWDGQKMIYEKCIIEGQNIHYTVTDRSKVPINNHNMVAVTEELVPGIVIYKDCTMLGGFANALIADVNEFNGSDATRNKSIWMYLGCNIETLRLKSFRPKQDNSPGRKNGFKFNFSATRVGLILGAHEVVDTSLANYEATSLPMIEEVEFMRNAGSTAIAWGQPVAYVYRSIKAHYYLDQEVAVNVPVGVEALTAANVKNFAGFSLVNSASGKFAHIRKKGKVATSTTTGALNDYLDFNSSGALTVITTGIPKLKVVGKYENNNTIVEIL